MSFGKIAASIAEVLIKKNRKIGRAVLNLKMAALGAPFFETFVAPAVTPVMAQTPVVTDEMMVKTADPEIEIYVRNKRPTNMTTFRPEQTVLYVHGATYPSETAFDLKLDGVSWMEFMAARGYDVWLLDLRGYGKSTRPPEMADQPEAIGPLCEGRPPSRTSVRLSISSCSAATYRGSTCWDGRGVRR